MIEKIDEKDKEIEKLEAEVAEEKAKVTVYSKLSHYNKPGALVFVAILSAAICGAVNPLFGVFLAKILSVLTVQKEILD